MCRLWVMIAVLLGSDVLAAEPNVPRNAATMAKSLAGVFLEGQVVAVSVPAQAVSAARWRVLDDRARTVKSGTTATSASSVELGELEIGWYRIEFLAQDETLLAWTTAAVLAKPAAPVPQDSPICIDSATAWFARNDRDKQDRLTLLASLAGVNWVRDRLRWRDIQPQGPQDFASPGTTYDTSASIQTSHGLKVLQVFHDTPPWAVAEGDKSGRYAGDLRDVYRFCQAMARRFHGTEIGRAHV